MFAWLIERVRPKRFLPGRLLESSPGFGMLHGADQMFGGDKRDRYQVTAKEDFEPIEEAESSFNG
jgi:hypothetical protein